MTDKTGGVSALPTWTPSEWHRIECLAKQFCRSYARYRNPDGPFYQSMSEKRLAAEASRILRSAGARSLRQAALLKARNPQ